MWRTYRRALVVSFGFASLSVAAGQSIGWLDVPFVRQEKNGCGAASVAMVMQYWIREGFYFPPESAEPHRVHAALNSPGANGAFASSLDSYLRDHGFKTFIFRGEWAELERHVAKGRPLIVCLQPGGRDDQRHFLVVVGVDDQRALVLVNDPARRKLTKLRRQNFEEEWKAANSWTLLALPAEDR